MTTSNVKNLTICIATIALFSCGQSKEQQVADEKRKMDSIANASAQNAKVELLKQQATQDSIKQNTAMQQAEKEGMTNRLITLKGDLAAEETKLEDIKSFHMGRLPAEKEQQIGQQTAVIEALKIQISDLETKLGK